jgi:hypothetical protein
MKLPEKVADKPEIIAGLDLYWKAFTDLMSDRDVGMAEGPIPWSAMSEWATRRRIFGDDFERFVYILRELDSAYMEHRGKEMKRGNSKAKRAARKGKAMRNK